MKNTGATKLLVYSTFFDGLLGFVSGTVFGWIMKVSGTAIGRIMKKCSPNRPTT